jgi:hypothetical protein
VTGTYTVWLDVTDSINTVSAPVSIVVEQPIPDLSLLISHVRIKSKHGHGDQHRRKGSEVGIDVKGHLETAFSPQPDDVIRLRIGGTDIFVATFADFAPMHANNQDEVEDDDNGWRKAKVQVGHHKSEMKWNLITGAFKLKVKKASLPGVEGGNTVFEARVWNGVALATVFLVAKDQHGKLDLHYHP